MNSTGGMRPRPGWFQRTSASTEIVLPVARSTIGWYWTISSRSVDRALELGLEAVAADDRVAHRGREHREAALAGLLGLVHGDVGVAQQLLDATSRGAGLAGDADARRTLSGSSPAIDGRANACSVRSASSTALRSTPDGRADEDGELVAAQPRDDVLAAHAAHEPRGDAAQQLSPIAWPSVSLTPLKSSRSMNITATSPDAAGLERLAHPLAEQRAVGEPGERVVVGLVLELVLQVAQLGDGLLEAVELQRGARVGGQRLEQRAVGLGEAAREPEAVREHERADHAILAAQHAEHAVADAALLAGRRRASAGNGSISATACSELVGASRAARRPRRGRPATIASRALPGPRPVRNGAPPSAANRIDLGLLGAERLERPLEQALQRDRDLGRLGQRPVGLVEGLDLLVALALLHVGAVAEEGDQDRDHQQRRRGRALDPEDAQTSAIAVPVTVTTRSMPNIWRTWSRETWPSVSTIAQRIWAIVSTPPSCVAARTAPQVIQPKPGSSFGREVHDDDQHGWTRTRTARG